MKSRLKTAVYAMLLIGLIPISGLLANGAEAKPNIVLILADDMGYSDLPKFGKSEIPTPAIDRLANEGVIFTDGYVTAPICVASRMGLMTGQYQQRFGIYGNIHDLRPYIIGENQSAPHEWLCWQNRTRAVRTPGGYVLPNIKEKEHSSAIRKGKWKMVRLAELLDSDKPPPPWQLFDLSKDIEERNNVADAHPEIVMELDNLFNSWRSSMHPSLEL
ncbi:MAG: sulfatase-like hydrolase/transferase [Verrucomicrobia bacterium]|nr:sulfatase-like hydrolase/transferase [Verrucomicrobiota bacterium]